MPRRESSPKPFSLPLAVALAINRLEGLVMTRDMRRLFTEFEALNLTHEEQRAALKARYGQSRKRTRNPDRTR